MKQIKGCLNSECTEYKKTKYRSTDEYCVKCGSKLSFVCQHPKCFKQLPDNSHERFCAYHIEEKKDKRDRFVDGVTKAGGRIAAGAVAIAGVAGTVLEVMKKNK